MPDLVQMALDAGFDKKFRSHSVRDALQKRLTEAERLAKSNPTSKYYARKLETFRKTMEILKGAEIQ